MQQPWRSLDKGESLASQIPNFPIQQKDRLFLLSNLFNSILKTTQLILEWGGGLSGKPVPTQELTTFARSTKVLHG